MISQIKYKSEVVGIIGNSTEEKIWSAIGGGLVPFAVMIVAPIFEKTMEESGVKEYFTLIEYFIAYALFIFTVGFIIYAITKYFSDQNCYKQFAMDLLEIKLQNIIELQTKRESVLIGLIRGLKSCIKHEKIGNNV